MLVSLDMVPVGMVPGYEEIMAADYFLGDDAAKVTTIGGSVNEPNLEDIAALKPDLIIGHVGSHGGPADGLREALRAIAPMYLYEDKNLDMVYANLRNVGALVDRTDQAEAAITEFSSWLDQAAARSPQDRTALMLSGTDTNVTTYLETSLQGSVFARVTPYPWPRTDLVPEGKDTVKYSIEEILRTDPDVIFLQDFAEGAAPLPEQLAANPIWRELTAVQKEEVISVPARRWHTSKQLIMMRHTVEEMLAVLYPGTFESPANALR